MVNVVECVEDRTETAQELSFFCLFLLYYLLNSNVYVGIVQNF
jgi:hypothetical protein